MRKQSPTVVYHTRTETDCRGQVRSIKEATCINKGRNREFYADRKKEVEWLDMTDAKSATTPKSTAPQSAELPPEIAEE